MHCPRWPLNRHSDRPSQSTFPPLHLLSPRNPSIGIGPQEPSIPKGRGIESASRRPQIGCHDYLYKEARGLTPTPSSPGPTVLPSQLDADADTPDNFQSFGVPPVTLALGDMPSLQKGFIIFGNFSVLLLGWSHLIQASTDREATRSAWGTPQDRPGEEAHQWDLDAERARFLGSNPYAGVAKFHPETDTTEFVLQSSN